MTLHPQMQRVLETLGESGASALTDGTVDDARATAAMVCALAGDGPAVAEVLDIEIPSPAGGIPARVYRPAGAQGTIVYLHGGGWVLCSVDDYDAVCRLLATESQCQVVSVDYRLAPEHRFPAAVDDAFAALTWVGEHLADDRPLIVAGDSAGANLAAVCALRAQRHGGPALALQVLVYPVTDADFDTPSYHEHAEGYLLGRADMIWFWDHYAPTEADRLSPDASPLRAVTLSGLPPAYVIVAEYDPLRDDGLGYAKRLEAEGVPVTLRHHRDMMHGFFGLPNVADVANRAIADVGEVVRQLVRDQTAGHGTAEARSP